MWGLGECCRFLGDSDVIRCAMGHGWSGFGADNFSRLMVSCLGGVLGMCDEVSCPVISPSAYRASRLCNWDLCGCVGVPSMALQVITWGVSWRLVVVFVATLLFAAVRVGVLALRWYCAHFV